METPMDVLNHRLGKIRDNGDIDFDNTMAAIDIDNELQEKFIFFPMEEIEAVEIEEDSGRLQAGSGPEHCAATLDENPVWLYNHALHALALWWRIKTEQEAAEEKARREHEEEERAIILSRRPAPGVYDLWTGGEQHFVVVTSDQRILSMKPASKHLDLTDIFDGMERKERWTFTLVETGLGADVRGDG